MGHVINGLQKYKIETGNQLCNDKLLNVCRSTVQAVYSIYPAEYEMPGRGTFAW